jgi:hypothetical protein
MTDAPRRLDVDRGLCIVLTVVSGAAVFAAEALHGEASGRTPGARPHLAPRSAAVAAAAPPTTRSDIGLEMVIDDREPPGVSRDAVSRDETPLELAVVHHVPQRPKEPIVATTLATIRANASAVEPAATRAHAMK